MDSQICSEGSCWSRMGWGICFSFYLSYLLPFLALVAYFYREQIVGSERVSCQRGLGSFLDNYFWLSLLKVDPEVELRLRPISFGQIGGGQIKWHLSSWLLWLRSYLLIGSLNSALDFFKVKFEPFFLLFDKMLLLNCNFDHLSLIWRESSSVQNEFSWFHLI